MIFHSVKTVNINGQLILKFTKEEGERLKYCPSTATELGGQNWIRDAYEESMTYLAPSKISSEAGDGLFSRTDVPINTLLSFYHGLNVPYDCDFSQELFAFDEVTMDNQANNNVLKKILFTGEEVTEQCV